MSSDQMPEFDLYKMLEVDPEARTETIEAAHRSLVRRFHPDVSADKLRALELNIARDWPTDPSKGRGDRGSEMPGAGAQTTAQPTMRPRR
jgi:DnaJ domain